MRPMPSEDIFSFDVFDTALRRELAHPSHLFCLLEKELQSNFSHTDWTGFAEHRRQAEKDSLVKIRWTKREEHSLFEIYESLRDLRKDLTVDESHFALQTEIDLERRSIRQNEHFHQFYLEARAQQKKIFFLSDMYLPSDFISEVLRKNGYEVTDNLYVSSTFGLTKNSGSLYRFFLKNEKLSSSQVRHFGDNEHADFNMALKCGIRSTLYRGPHSVDWNKPLPLTPEISRLSVLQAKSQVKSPPESCGWTKMGMSYGALIYGGYLKWIKQKLIEHSLEDVYFLSRDGYILNEISQRLNLFPAGQAKYLMASRLVLNLSVIKDRLRNEDLDFLCGGFIGQAPFQYLTRIGIPESKARSLAKLHFSNINKPRHPGEDIRAYHDLFRSAEELILDVCERLRKRICTYFKQVGIGSLRKFALVDLGWHGSLQLRLVQLLNELGIEPEIHGFYYGLFSNVAKNRAKGLILHSFTVNEFHSPDQQESILQSVQILEKLFAAPHGGVRDYIESENGRIQPVFASNPDELIEYQQKIFPFQKAALTTLDHCFDEIHPSESLQALNALALYPSHEETRLIGSLVHFDGFEHTGPSRKLVDKDIRPRNARHLEQLYHQSYWKPGLLRHFSDRYPKILMRSDFLCERARRQGLI